MYDDFTMEELAQFAQFRRKMIGKNIRLIRKVQGLSLRNLEEETGINFTQLSYIENGTRNAGVDSITKIAACLKCMPELLWRNIAPIPMADRETAEKTKFPSYRP